MPVGHQNTWQASFSFSFSPPLKDIRPGQEFLMGRGRLPDRKKLLCVPSFYLCGGGGGGGGGG
eukprot:scaffold16176_cov107-Amphora_coffeaeformis.AAC.1